MYFGILLPNEKDNKKESFPEKNMVFLECTGFRKNLRKASIW